MASACIFHFDVDAGEVAQRERLIFGSLKLGDVVQDGQSLGVEGLFLRSALFIMPARRRPRQAPWRRATRRTAP